MQPGAYISREQSVSCIISDSSQMRTEDWPYNGKYDGWWGHDTLPKLNYEESVKLGELYFAYRDANGCRRRTMWMAGDWMWQRISDDSNEYNHQFWKKFREVVKECESRCDYSGRALRRSEQNGSEAMSGIRL